MSELQNYADNVTFDGVDVDGGFAQQAGFQNHGAANVTFKNGRIGNITDEKGALVTGPNFTFDNVVFHDVRVTNSSVHNECVYALDVQGMVVRNSTFTSCATMDLFFTYGSWWSPLPPAYGNITLENNVFGHSVMPEPGSWHYYSLYVGNTANGGGTVSNWTVRNNTFEIAANLSIPGSGNSRWVGNLGDWNCASGVTFRYNVGNKCSATDKQVNPAASSRTTTAPFGWVNPAAQDFHLNAGSPAIGAADPNDYPATDRDGLQRDARPDAGAHEYGARPPGAGGGNPGGNPGSGAPLLRKPLVRSATLSRHVICKRRKRCPKVTRLRLSVSTPSTVAVRLYRLRRGKKGPKLVRRKLVTVRAQRKIAISSRGLRRGRYRIVAVARTKAGRKSAPQVFRLRVR